MILILIGLLFLILTIFWYLLVKNIIYEDLTFEQNDRITDKDNYSSEEEHDDNSVEDNDLEDDDDESGDSFTESIDSGPGSSVSYICLLSGDQYLNINSDYKLTLGRKGSNSIYKVIDSGPGTETVQLESLKYPGYLLYYHNEDPHFRTGNYAKDSSHTVFTPLGMKDAKNRIALLTRDRKYCLENKGGQLIFAPFNERYVMKRYNKPNGYIFNIEKAKV